MGLSKPALGTALAVILALSTAPLVGPAAASTATAVTGTASTVSATWSTDRVALGGAASVTGVVSSVGGGIRPVHLDLLLASGWRTLATGETDSSGSYRLTVPTDFYRSAQLAVSAPATTTATAATSAGRVVKVVSRGAAAGSAASWAPFSTAVRYRLDPCTTVGYRVNLEQAKAGSLADVKEAFTRVHRASGITFRYLGTTTALPPSEKNWPSDATIVVGWARPRQTSWKMTGSTLGVGGPVLWHAADDASGSVRRTVRAGVVIDSTEKLGGGFATGARRGKVLMHEIGHAVGLGHVASTSQRMHHVVTKTSSSRWGAGDLAGMRSIGLLQGCVTDRT